jgi:outer membrane protein OmpA-like peptidoglycan-associated protein
MYVHGDFLWNMSNALGGYKETRFWNFVPYLHAGYFRSYGLDGADFADNEIAAGAGLLHNLRLSNRIDLIVDMKAIMVNGRVCASEELAILPSVTMGLAVDLGWPSFVRTSSVIAAVETANLVQIEALEAAAVALELANEALVNENEQLSSMNDDLNKEVAALKNHPKYDASDFFKGMTPAAVYFDIGKAVLDEKQLCNLDFLAKNIIAKADKNAKIIMTVMGSADSNTGSEGRNKALSEVRGKYVFDILTGKYGISKSRLTVKSEVVKADDKPELSRAVMISF